MNKTTGLWALNLITIGTALIISCGGSSDDGDTTTGGSSSTSGSSTGGSASGGTSSAGSTSGGTTSAGTSSTAGTTTGGTGSGGTGNNAGGDGPGPGAGGDGPSAGGNGNADECPASQPTDGAECEVPGFMGCDYGDITCRCQRQQGGQGQGARTWNCDDGGNNGAGGDNGFGDATCPANAEDGDACTGTGLCTGQQGCVCFNEEVNCF
jgi:hypothetical protein